MRVTPNEDLDALELGRWLGRVKSAIRGRRGQRFLRDLERALVALPVKRLIRNSFCRDGEVCLTGAAMVQKRVDAGMTREAAMREVHKTYDADMDEEDWGSDEGAAVVEGEFDVAESLAWEAVYQNDETAGTPEHRYEACLRWVQRNIKP